MPKKPGPEPETLKIEGNWEDAVKNLFKKGKPPAPTKKSKNAAKKKSAAKKRR